MPVIKDREVYEEEQERRRLMLEVIARSLDTFTKQRRKDILLHKEDLKGNEFETVPFEDSEATDSANEKPSQPIEPKERVDVYIPTENSLITEILMET